MSTDCSGLSFGTTTSGLWYGASAYITCVRVEFHPSQGFVLTRFMGGGSARMYDHYEQGHDVIPKTVLLSPNTDLLEVATACRVLFEELRPMFSGASFQWQIMEQLKTLSTGSLDTPQNPNLYLNPPDTPTLAQTVREKGQIVYQTNHQFDLEVAQVLQKFMNYCQQSSLAAVDQKQDGSHVGAELSSAFAQHVT